MNLSNRHSSQYRPLVSLSHSIPKKNPCKSVVWTTHRIVFSKVNCENLYCVSSRVWGENLTRCYVSLTGGSLKTVSALPTLSLSMVMKIVRFHCGFTCQNQSQKLRSTRSVTDWAGSKSTIAIWGTIRRVAYASLFSCSTRVVMRTCGRTLPAVIGSRK